MSSEVYVTLSFVSDNNLFNLLEYIFPFHLLFCGTCTLFLRSREMSRSKIFFSICTGNTEILLMIRLEKGGRAGGMLPREIFETRTSEMPLPFGQPIFRCSYGNVVKPAERPSRQIGHPLRIQIIISFFRN